MGAAEVAHVCAAVWSEVGKLQDPEARLHGSILGSWEWGKWLCCETTCSVEMLKVFHLASSQKGLSGSPSELVDESRSGRDTSAHCALRKLCSLTLSVFCLPSRRLLF